jgi:hypothetical protein
MELELWPQRYHLVMSMGASIRQVNVSFRGRVGGRGQTTPLCPGFSLLV